MTERLRVVFDTNVFVSAYRSRNANSPTRELIDRWLAGEFILLTCNAIVDEVIEKLTALSIATETIEEIIVRLDTLAEWIEVPAEAIKRVVLKDSDDDIVVACAIIGKADFLVTYDPHIFTIDNINLGIRITKALPFLWAVRGDSPPDIQL